MRRDGVKCRAKNFVGAYKCAGSIQFVEFYRLVQFWVETDLFSVRYEHFLSRPFLRQKGGDIVGLEFGPLHMPTFLANLRHRSYGGEWSWKWPLVMTAHVNLRPT